MKSSKMAITAILFITMCVMSSLIEARYMPNERLAAEAVAYDENQIDQNFGYGLQVPGLFRFGKRHFPGMMRFGKRSAPAADSSATGLDKRVNSVGEADDVRLKYALPVFRIWY